jgi:hypothetical protein
MLLKRRIVMPQGDKYSKFTKYLNDQINKGLTEVKISFSGIEQILGAKLPPSSRTNQWSNNNRRSLSLGWLNSGFVITSFPNLADEDPVIVFSYNQDRADAILTGNTINKKTDYENILKSFLQDIDCLEELSEWSNKFNLFDVLKLSRTEIRHSNMLAWLFDPNENHGMGDRVLRALINFIILNYKPENLDEFSMVSMDLYSFEVRREWEDIDLLIVSNDAKVAICIENKIDSVEHSDQLTKYKKIMESNFYENGYNIVYIYLSPDGKLPSDESWNVMTYNDILLIVERESAKSKLNEQIKFLIENYMDVLRREIVEDQRLKKICAEIYAKHKEALDLIYEHRLDEILNISAIVKDWCNEQRNNGNLFFDEKNSQKGVVRFQTPKMSSILPDSDENISVWKNKQFYFYEIHITTEKLRVLLVVSMENLPYREELNKRNFKLGQEKKYKTIWSSQNKNIQRKQNTGVANEDQIISCLNELFKEVQKNEKEYNL